MRRQAISNSTGLDYWLVKKNRQKRRQGAAPMPGAKQTQPSLSSDMTMDYLPCRMGMPRLNRGRKAAGTAWAGSGKDGSGALPLPFIRKNGRNWQGNPHDTGKAGASCQRHLQYARGFLDSACEPSVHALRREACPAQGKSSSSSPFAASPAIPASGAFASALFVLPDFASALTGFPA